MYKCNDCGCEFDEPRVMTAEAFYGVDNEFPNTYGHEICVCPKCKSDNFDEVDDDENDGDE